MSVIRVVHPPAVAQVVTVVHSIPPRVLKPGRVTASVSRILTASSGGGGGGSTLTVVDNGDGTLTLSGSGVVDNGDGTLTITSTGLTDNGDGTLTLTG